MPEYQIVPDGWDGPSTAILGPTTIGRGPWNALRLDSPKVSRVHCEIRPNYDGDTNRYPVVIQDLNSRNGVWINKLRLRSESIVGPGDIIAIGDPDLRFRISMADEQHAKRHYHAIAIARQIADLLGQDEVAAAIERGERITLSVEIVPPDPMPIVAIVLGNDVPPECVP